MITKELENIIKRIYKEKDYEFFKERCKENIDLDEELLSIAKELNFEIIKEKGEEKPNQKFFFKTREYRRKGFKIRFKTMLNISKIYKCFYTKCSVLVENAKLKTLREKLEDNFTSSRTINQEYLNEKIIEILNLKGYKELYYYDLKEVIFDIYEDYDKYLEDGVKQPNVENLIFDDFENILKTK